jgi:hypothetical protein
MSRDFESELSAYEAKEADIVRLFRPADEAYAATPNGFAPYYMRYLEDPALNDLPLNFAVLERLFRKHHFQTYFLAEESDAIMRANPSLVVTDINLIPKQQLAEMPFAAVAYPTYVDLMKSVANKGLTYDETTNLQNLRRAGIPMLHPRYHGIREAGRRRVN